MIRVTYSNPMHVSLQPSEFPACTFTIFLIKHVLVNFTFEKYYDVRTPDVSVFFYFIFYYYYFFFLEKAGLFYLAPPYGFTWSTMQFIVLLLLIKHLKVTTIIDAPRILLSCKQPYISSDSTW